MNQPLTDRRQFGFANAYLIVVIALFSLAAYAMSQMYDANAQLRWSKNASDLVFDQALLIRKQVIACGTSYPDGINTDPASLAHYKKYPASSAVLDGIACPGAPSDQRYTWAGRDGVFLRKLPQDFGTWSYGNNSAGLTVTVQSSTVRGKAALAKAAGRFNPAEASFSGSQFTFVVASP